MSFADVMKNEANGRRRESVTLCFNSEIDRTYRELEVELRDALAAESRPSDDDRRPNRRAAEKNPSYYIAEKMAALREEHAAAFHEFVCEAKPRAEWLALRSAHSPRDGHPEDGGVFNSDTFPPAAVAACLVDPEPTPDVIGWLEENLTSGDWDALGVLCWAINEGNREAPKAERVSSILAGTANE